MPLRLRASARDLFHRRNKSRIISQASNPAAWWQRLPSLRGVFHCEGVSTARGIGDLCSYESRSITRGQSDQLGESHVDQAGIRSDGALFSSIKLEREFEELMSRNSKASG